MNPTGLRLLGATMETQSSTEAVQEVNILTSTFAPEFGAGGGAVVNVVTKSGTNDLHGTAYDYLVNTDLNAAQPYTGLKNAIHQNDYGFTVGAPVWIPKVYNGHNKTFFFLSFEEFLQNITNDTTPATVPIPAYRAGNFSSLITTENRFVSTAAGAYTDPLGRTIPSGTIFDPSNTFTGGQRRPGPQSFHKQLHSCDPSFDPVAVKILALVPLPLGANASQAGSNYLAPWDGSRRSYIPSGSKVDHNIGAKLHASFYFQKTSTSTPRTLTGADDLPNDITVSGTSGNAARAYRLNLDHTVTPRLLIHYPLGWNDSDFHLGPEDLGYNAQTSLGLIGSNCCPQLPARSFTGVSTNIAGGGMNTLGGSNTTSTYWERRPSFVTSTSYVRGAHTYKVGFEIRQMKYPNFNWIGAAGNYTTGTSTSTGNASNWTTQTSLNGATVSSGFAGFGFASFLLGGLQAVSLDQPFNLMTENYQSAMFLQDSWKVTRKLTLDYGLRWDYGTYQKEQFGRYGDFSATTPNPSADGRPGAIIYEANCNCNFAHNYPFAIGPRLGGAYQLDRNTVIRGGIGVVYGNLDSSAATGYASNSATASTPAFGQINGLLQNGIPSSVQAAWPTLSNPAAGQAPGGVVPAPTLLDQNTGRPMRLLQWIITAERTIGRDMVVEAGYVGNRGVWEVASGAGLAPQNDLSQSTLAGLGIPSSDFTNATLAQAFNTNISGHNTAQKQALASVGLTHVPPLWQLLPAEPDRPSESSGSVPSIQRGYASRGALPLGKNWYDALQTRFTKRFSHGFTANANYTWSKTMALTGTVDPFNRNLGQEPQRL